jgi:hypothetical protein
MAAGLLIVLNLSYAFSQAPLLETEYDRFKDETKVGVSTSLENHAVEIPFSQMQEFLTLMVWASHRGKQVSTAPATVKLVFRSQARDWRFGEGTQLLGIVDGARLALGSMKYFRRDLGAGHLETLEIDLPTRTFLKLAHAKTVELRIGNKDVKLGTQNLAALSALADYLNGKAVSQLTPGQRQVQQTAPIIANQVSQPRPEDKPNSFPSASTTNKCPVQPAQVLPIRNFRLGMTTAEYTSRFRGKAPALSQPDDIGIRSVMFNWSRDREPSGSTGLDKLEFKFFDDRLYQMEATYSVGSEWKSRQRSEFAESISRGLGVEGAWSEEPFGGFKLDCGGVRFELTISNDLAHIIPGGPWAYAYLTLVDSAAEAQVSRKREELRLDQQRRDAEKRKIFRP